MACLGGCCLDVRAFIVDLGAGAWLAEGIGAWRPIARVWQAAELVGAWQAAGYLSVTIRELITVEKASWQPGPWP